MSSSAGPPAVGWAMVRALALASLTIEIGPCSPAANNASVTNSGASVSAFHSSSVNADLSVMASGPF